MPTRPTAILPILEMFRSIQGEGPYSGRPYFFVRTHGCNLRCGPCDTKYAWSAMSGMSEECLLAGVSGERFIVLTGGEPLLDARVPEVILRSCDLEHLIVETNGTIRPSEALLASRKICWSVSPKLPWFCDHYDVNLDAMSGLLDSDGEVYYKFVVRGIVDMEEALVFVRTMPISYDVVFQPPQPCIHSDAAVRRYLRTMARLAGFTADLQRDWPGRLTLLPQLHWLLWGGARRK